MNLRCTKGKQFYSACIFCSQSTHMRDAHESLCYSHYPDHAPHVMFCTNIYITVAERNNVKFVYIKTIKLLQYSDSYHI